MVTEEDVVKAIHDYVEENQPEPIEVLKGTLGYVVNMIGPNMAPGDDAVEFEFSGEDGTKCVVTIAVKPADEAS